MANCRSLCTAVRLFTVAGAVCALSAAALGQQQPGKLPAPADATSAQQAKKDPKLSAVSGATEKALPGQAKKYSVMTPVPPASPRGVPPNDNCAGATPVGEGVFAYDNISATFDGPAATCAPMNSDVWFLYSPSATGVGTFTTCSASRTHDTVMRLFAAPCLGAQLACNDDGPPFCSNPPAGFSGSTFSAPVTAGTQYLVEIASYGVSVQGGSDLTITLAAGGLPNDNCGTPTVIAGPSGTVATNTVGASTDGIWPCAAGGTDVWYSWTAPATGSVTFSFCPTEGGSAAYDTALQMTTACGVPPSVCNDDNCGLSSKISFGTSSGTTYLIGVGGFASGSGTGTLGWAMLNCNGPIPNDCCINATAIGEGTFPWSNVGANSDGPSPCGGIGSDIWFAYTPSVNGIATVTTCSDLRTVDTVMAVWTGGCGALVNVNCNDDGPPFCAAPGAGFSGSTISWCASAGTSYLIQVGGFVGQQGTSDLTVSVAAACGVTAPPGAVDEGEPCDSTIPPVDTVNGGCNSTPPVFGTIACGGAVTGTAWASSNWRDTDWYQFTVAECSTIQVDGSGQFPLQLFLLNGTCPPSILAAGSAPACGTASLTSTIGAGTYAVFAADQGFNGNPCGACNNYWVSLTCTPIGGGPPNDNCASATAVGPGTFPFDIQCSSNDYPGSCGASFSSPDVWFDYTATQNGIAIVNTCNQTALDTVLTALDGSCGGTEIVCVDDACGLQTQITFAISAGSHYLIRVAGFAGQVGAGTITITEGQPPANDECAGAVAIAGQGTFDYDNSLATTGSEGQNTPECNFFGSTTISNDIWFRWTSDFTGTAEISFCGFTFSDTKVAVYTNCPDSGGTTLTCNDDCCGLQSRALWPVTSGTSYVLQVGNFPGASGGPGSFSILPGGGGGPTCTSWTPAAGATPEGEACGSDTNGGCNSFPPIYTEVTCNGTWTGLAWSFCGTRDTDWYRFTLTSTTTVSATSDTAFNGVLFIVSGIDTCAPAVIANTTTSCGLPGTVSMSLAPGTYVIFVATGDFDGTPCGGDNGYNVTIDIGAAPCTPPCACDFNHDGLLNSQDFFDFLNCFFTAGCAAADFNNDGIANSQDFFDFLNCFFAGC